MIRFNKLYSFSTFCIFALIIFLVFVAIYGYNLISASNYHLGHNSADKYDSISSYSSYESPNNEPIVFHLSGESVNSIYTSDKMSGNIIPSELIIQPGIYNFLTYNYFFKNEGLYRLILPGKINEQRIVFKNDLDALLSAICWIASHGNSDNNRTNAELSYKATQDKLFITCSRLSLWAHYTLSIFDIKSRLVAGLTADEWNNYNNGHSFIEIYRPKWKKWVLYDLDNNSYFISDKRSGPLSLIEFSNTVINGNYEIVYMSSDTRLDASSFTSSNGYNYAFIMEEINTNIRCWYRRVMQVPLIFDNSYNKYFFMDDMNKERIESYSSNYRYLDKKAFISRFYSYN